MTTAPGHRRHVHVEHCMGTVFSVGVAAADLPGGLLEAEFARIAADLQAIDRTFSTYRPDSQISRLDAGALTLENASPQVRAVLSECARFERLTDGYFSSRPDGHALDPSGYVKGWAVQRAAETLAAALHGTGATGSLVNGGGDVVCTGVPEPGRAWRIGISDPHHRGRLLTTVETTGPVAVATSGPAERGAHILDPHHGRPATGLSSVTVIATDLITADVYATAAVAMGPDRAGTWLQENRLQAVLVLPDGSRQDIGISPGGS